MPHSYDNLFNRSISFDQPSNGTFWTVPAGVTLIAVDLWAGGGGGGPLGGGQGGGYLHGTIKVNPGTVLTIAIGAGGMGGTSTTGNFAAPGGNTVLLNLTAIGGAPNGTNNAGGFTIGNGLGAGWGLTGQFGKPMDDLSYLYVTPTLNNTTYKCGQGGNGANSQDTRGTGAFSIIQTNTATAIYSSKPLYRWGALNGISPGGGGGGGHDWQDGLNPIQHVPGAAGGNGKAIIYYNQT
ncbi:glycine-rich domain-containing protein [Mucilaginibacter sp. AW1-3]